MQHASQVKLTTLSPDQMHVLRQEVVIALGKVRDAGVERIINWNGRELVLTRTEGKRADAALERPGCLGVYNANSDIDATLADLIEVIEPSAPARASRVPRSSR
ncbi:hypothetical protein [Cupriavidus malaysiensis]|uniref:Uncharacterized protein n=1 Tax=Cupriavidus malaysiensis TaxID=367825 RepID=A0ABM6FGN2_9BURK|nr:hypothetical protein [Cupriavidus malaysiensis]AOZ11107.1 hypothetical protein BKK80_34675 [Cupriavidus malaysiensis]